MLVRDQVAYLKDVNTGMGKVCSVNTYLELLIGR
jgi:hypothetical protein